MRPSRSASLTSRSASGGVTSGSSLRRERLGQQLQRADRRLELVTHVGDEVAAHALDPVDLRDVVDEHRGAQRAVARRAAAPMCNCRTARGGPKSESSRSHDATRHAPRRGASRSLLRRRRRRAARRGSARRPDCGSTSLPSASTTTTPSRRRVEHDGDAVALGLGSWPRSRSTSASSCSSAATSVARDGAGSCTTALSRTAR